VLAGIGLVRGGASAQFIRENYARLSFSEDELIGEGTGLLSIMFPSSWREPGPGCEEADGPACAGGSLLLEQRGAKQTERLRGREW